MLSNLKVWSYFSEDSSKKTEEIDDLKKEDVENEKTAEINVDNPSNTEKVKDWGNYFLDMGKTVTNKAAKQVSSTAKQIRQNVSGINIIEQSNIITKFSDEQIKFTEEKRLIEKQKRESCLPWIDALNRDESEQRVLRTKILLISTDERNFLRNPPAGSGFEFNYDLSAPVAQILLSEDENLAAMRYRLVPKKIKEEMFWRNYFYRVFLIKQSLQSDPELKDNGAPDIVIDGGDGIVDGDGKEHAGVDRMTDDVMGGLTILKGDGGKENDDLEAELQKELSEFELVNEDNGQDAVIDGDKGDYDDLEREILSELGR